MEEVLQLQMQKISTEQHHKIETEGTFILWVDVRNKFGAEMAVGTNFIVDKKWIYSWCRIAHSATKPGIGFIPIGVYNRKNW
jgi:hypothetical protein